MFDKGGYTVQPLPAPVAVNEDEISIKRDGGNSQNLILFIRGKAISGAPIMIGMSQLPNPPIMMGMTMKKIMMKAWAVTITLNRWSFCSIISECLNFIRINILIEAPIIADHKPNPKYIVPMSLWFVE